jgi:pimeloyl-ACP methyl ester carboxylesterase
MKRTTLTFGTLLGAMALIIGSAAVHAEPVAPPAPDPVTKEQMYTSERMSVEVLGTGPNVILLPGYACSREVWRPLATRLAGRYRVHLVQYAGFADEPGRPTGDGYIQPLLDDLARYIRESNLQKPAVIGHSMGGMLAVGLAEQHPTLLGRLLSVDSLPFFQFWLGKTTTPEAVQLMADEVAATMVANDEAGFYDSQVKGAATLTYNVEMRSSLVNWAMASDRMSLAAALRDLMTLDLRPGLATMTTPVWLVYAADARSGNSPDKATEIWKREYAALPNAHFVMVNHSRHFIMADQPEQLARVVEEFLR